jgi:hypothetical protein
MRSRRLRFALFAVIPVAASVFTATAPAHAAASPTETKILWRDQNGAPSGNTKFYVRVENTGGTTPPEICAPNTECAPQTVVTVKFDAATLSLPLRAVDGGNAAITEDFVRDLANQPHYLIATYPGKADTFGSSSDELGLATADFRADPEPSRQGELVTFTFSLSISPSTPSNRKPSGSVAFNDNDGHATGPVHPGLGADLKASWTLGQRTGRWVVNGYYLPSDNEFFLPVGITREHQVLAGEPGATVATVKPTTTRRPVAATNRSGTTAALAPINPGANTSTSLGEISTTVPTFGAFPTTPRVTTPASTDQNEGPPIAVVITTLLALGVLGGIAAFRRYRRSAIDWF